jgi:uncharacterized Zn finger protein (UPF0148 family)
MSTKNADHIILNTAHAGHLQCLHCGATYDMKLPQPAGAVLVLSGWFRGEHIDCKLTEKGEACTYCLQFGHEPKACKRLDSKTPRDHPVRIDCPECGSVRFHDGEGCCASCGMDLCLVYEDRREYVTGSISRSTWNRIVMNAAREFGFTTPAMHPMDAACSLVNGARRVKRTQLIRKTPLKARQPMRRRSRIVGQFDRKARSPIRKRARKYQVISPEDIERLAWLRTLPCCAPGHENCPGPVGVHHDTQHRAKGKKSPHSRGMPMCTDSHVFGFHANAGPFKGWKKAQLRAWQDEQVAKYQALWDARENYS